MLTYADLAINNARHWVEQLENVPEGAHLPADNLSGASRAIESLLPVPGEEAWALSQALVTLLRRSMEKQGHWAEWDFILELLLDSAREREDDLAELKLLKQHAALQQYRGEYRNAITLFRHILALAERCVQPADRAVALSNLGYLYYVARLSLHEAEATSREALALFEELGDARRAAYTLNHLGLIYLGSQRYEVAETSFHRARQIFEELEDPTGLAQVHQNLGILHVRVRKFVEALEDYREAIRYYREVEDELNAARVQFTMAGSYIRMSELNRAEGVCLQAEKVLERFQDRLSLARVRHNLGMIYTRQENFTEAERCFTGALEEWRNRENVWNVANTLGELVRTYLEQGKHVEARNCLDEAWSLVEAHTEPFYTELREELLELHQRLDEV